LSGATKRHKKRPAIGVIQIAGRRENQCDAKIVLEDAEHDGSDKSECEIRGDNAQLVDERTDEGHQPLPGSRRCPH
jgi:hypothetical protein